MIVLNRVRVLQITKDENKRKPKLLSCKKNWTINIPMQKKGDRKKNQNNSIDAMWTKLHQRFKCVLASVVVSYEECGRKIDRTNRIKEVKEQSRKTFWNVNKKSALNLNLKLTAKRAEIEVQSILTKHMNNRVGCRGFNWFQCYWLNFN